ncbi:50S ribosomal protein L32e [Candidatus Woesearchaeota archaeon]|nr:50S ribosomal protein L32e [Candidatus Woesearchaeota archaeon]
MKELLDIRKAVKSKKPTFSRQDSHKKPKLGTVWRRPKGLQSKMRLMKRGYKRRPEVGWGSPKSVKGLSPEGLMPVSIASAADVEALDAKKDGAMLKRTLGTRKKSEIVKALVARKITILNMKNPDEFLKGLEKKVAEKKAVKTEAKKQKEARKKELSKKAEEKKEEKIETAEDKKKEEKTTKDKIITKKD